MYRLKPLAASPAPELGLILHDYLSTYYQWIAASSSSAPPGVGVSDDAHNAALMKITADYVPEIKTLARRAEEVGAYETAEILSELPNVANRIAQRYYLNLGKFDAERYDVLYVEESLSMDLTPRIRSNGKVDLVTQDRETGLVVLWEHKSTTSVPDMSYRMRDLQTILYAEKLAHLYDIRVDQINWNYMRTKEPTIPKLLKSGQLSQAADIDSTWEAYAAEVANQKLDLTDYDKMRELLEGRELSVFFPRFTQALVGDPNVLLRDYIVTAKDIRRHKRAWAEGTLEPTRNLQRDCSWFCEFKSLCNAVVMGGDDDELIDLSFRKT